MTQRRRIKDPPWKEWERLSCRNGLRHGIFSTGGDKYLGEWRDDFKGGKGYLRSTTGWLYEGDWKQGMRHGYGVLSKQKKSGCTKINYVGQWCRGKKEGKGRQIYDDGSIYQGDWLEGKRHGHGRMWHNNGDFYEGDWNNDQPHGNGIFVYANGCRYEGGWLNGLMHGYGRFYHLKTGQLQEGLWINGVGHHSDFYDIPFRQSTLNPTQYPIQHIELEDSADVIRQAEEQITEDYEHLDQSKVTFEGLKK